MDYIISILPQMWLGTIETLKLFFITIVLSIPLGILLALARVSSLGGLRSAVGVYVWLLRGTPLMLQLLFVYYGLPFIPGIGIRMDDFQAAIFAFVLNYAAYFCEIFRAGILPLLHLLTVLFFQQHCPMPGIEHGGTLAFRLSHFGLFLELRQIS